MLQIVFATLAIFLLIFLGSLLLRAGWLSRTFWNEAEKLIYYLLFPALLLRSVADAELVGLAVPPMAGALIGSMLVATVVLLALRPLLGIDGPAFTSLFQGVLRMNTYLAFAVAFAIAGQPGVEATAVAVAIFVPVANLLCVTVLVRYGRGAETQGSSALWRTLKAIATNPLIVAILAGVALNLSGLGLPPVLDSLLDILGHAALGLGLLAVGAGLDFRAARTGGTILLLATVLKLAAMPALAFGLARLLGLEGNGLLAVVLLNALPTSGAAYILARQLGGNAPLMASIVTLQTACSMASLPLVLGLLP